MVRRNTENNNSNTISVTVAVLGNQTYVIDLPVDSTVGDAFDKAGYNLSSNEFAMVEGESAEMSDVLDDKDVITVTSHKTGGNA